MSSSPIDIVNTALSKSRAVSDNSLLLWHDAETEQSYCIDRDIPRLAGLCRSPVRTTMVTEPQDILEEQKKIFEEKNDDYSDTWIVSGLALSALHDEPVTLNGDIDHIVNGNVHRLLDKILRGYNAAVIADDMNFEASVDSFRDATTYSSMITSIIEEDRSSRLGDAYKNAKGRSETETETDTDTDTRESNRDVQLHVSAHDRFETPGSGESNEQNRETSK